MKTPPRNSPPIFGHFLLASFAMLLHPTPFLRAATVSVDGTDGTNGTSATLGGSGGNGGNGQSVTATADASGDATNLATAKAGRGGSGGNGGGGSTGNPSFPPGFGGDGGNGGSATAIANTDLSGGGGNALANALATGDGGGGPGGDGGDYSAFRHGAAGFDGTFSATASAVTSTGSARAEAHADPNGYGGGTGFASATASNASSDGVYVWATAAGGSGRPSGQGSAEPGATATLGTVTGTSTGGGAVTVRANLQGGLGGVTSVGGASGGAGGAASLVNAVSGSTTGALSLQQGAQAGRGGSGDVGGAGGFGSSRLTYVDTTASSLSANLSASGGDGAELSAAGSATAELHLSSIGNIPVASVDAIGGKGGDGPTSGAIGVPGSTALLLPSSAVTTGTGKTVLLRAQQVGGGGGRAATGGRGADSHMLNVVSGAAPGGTLKLEQSATSGFGGRGNLGLAGDGGDASSSLTFIHSGEQKLEVTVNADAQRGGFDSGVYFGGVGGDATASGTVQDSQDVTLKVDAEAGDGSNGGDSSATASAISTGAGIVVVDAKSTGGSVTSLSGAKVPGNAILAAYGESQGGPVSVSGTANAGGFTAYGNAPSLVNGQAVSLANAVTGRSSGALTLTQTANAGAGAANPNAGSTGGNGGDAHSSIILPGGNPDGGDLTATVWAAGGDAYFDPGTQIPGTPGNATAVCDLQNAGDVRAEAQATPGRAGSQFSLPASSPSPASATARAISSVAFSQAYAEASHGGVPASSGTLSATAKTFGGVFSEVSATASASSTISAAPSVGCRVGPRAITFGGSLMVFALPPSFGSLPANSATALLNLSPLAEINLSSSFSSASTTLVMQPGGYSGPLKLALVSGSASSSTGLSSVHFTVARGGSTLIDQTFTDWSVLATYFNDQVIDLGQVSAGQPLTFSFTLGGSSTGFSTRMWLGAAQTPFSAWASGYGLANALTAGNDSDRDGESDLLEFAFDSDPLDGSRGSYLPVQILADRVRIQFTRRRGDTQGLTYLLETSSSLAGPAAWDPMAAPWTVNTDDLSDTLESVTCEILREEASDRVFIRMSVESE